MKQIKKECPHTYDFTETIDSVEFKCVKCDYSFKVEK